MTISQELTTNGIRMTLIGALDDNTAPDFSIALLSAVDEYDHVTVDFSGLTEMEDAGLRVLLSAQKKADVTDVTLIVTAVPDFLLKTFEAIGFLDILQQYGSAEHRC